MSRQNMLEPICGVQEVVIWWLLIIHGLILSVEIVPLKLSEGIYKRLLDDEMVPALYAQFVAQLL